jgi:hypothetical protein
MAATANESEGGSSFPLKPVSRPVHLFVRTGVSRNPVARSVMMAIFAFDIRYGYWDHIITADAQ